MLFSSELSESDISLRDTYFTSATLVKFAIFFEMGDDFILSLIDVHSPSKDDLTAFFNLAVCNSSVHLLEELAKRGADTQTGNYYPDFLPIMSAAKAQSCPEVIDFLLSKGASLEAHTDFGENLLHLAADNPSSEMLKCLLQKIVPLHPEYLEENEERDELTPLAIARIFGFRKNQRALIKAGANKKNAKHRKDRFWYERAPDEDRAKELVSIRGRNLDRNFEWTPENTQKIISVIQGIDKKVNEMYDKALKVQEFLESLPLPDGVERYYFIKADLDFEPESPLPTADEEMMERLYDATNWNILPSVILGSDRLTQSREQQLYLGLNWDIELFDRPELEHIKIPYYVHALFVDEFSYSLTDMLHMKAEDFKIKIEVSFDGEAIV